MRRFVLAAALGAVLAMGQGRDASRGEALYGARCAGCHGRDGRGGEAPNLHKSRLVVLSPPARLFDVVRNGIPGTGMPPLAGPDADAWDIVAFVHSVAKPGMGKPVEGDVEAGRGLFRSLGCARCHIVEGKGGVLGPDLSSIALQSSTAEIRESVLEPAAKVRPGYRPVTVVVQGKGTIMGVLKNEDNFSMQVMSLGGVLRGLTRAELERVDLEPGTRMPAARLSARALQDLLAFLDRQRAPHLRTEIGFANY